MIRTTAINIVLSMSIDQNEGLLSGRGITIGRLCSQGIKIWAGQRMRGTACSGAKHVLPGYQED